MTDARHPSARWQCCGQQGNHDDDWCQKIRDVQTAIRLGLTAGGPCGNDSNARPIIVVTRI